MQRPHHKTDTSPISLFKNFKLFPFWIKFTKKKYPITFELCAQCDKMFEIKVNCLSLLVLQFNLDVHMIMVIKTN